MSEITLRVAPGRILVEPVELEPESSRIITPETVRKDPPTLGRVLQVASDLDWMNVKADGTMFCVFRPHAGVVTEVDGRLYRIITPESIDGFFSWSKMNGSHPGARP